MDQWFMAAAACGDSIIWITDPGGHFMKLDIISDPVVYRWELFRDDSDRLRKNAAGYVCRCPV